MGIAKKKSQPSWMWIWIGQEWRGLLPERLVEWSISVEAETLAVSSVTTRVKGTYKEENYQGETDGTTASPNHHVKRTDTDPERMPTRWANHRSLGNLLFA